MEVSTMTQFHMPPGNEFRVRRVASILGVSHQTISKAIADKSIVAHQGHDILGRPAKWLVIPRSEVERLARQMGLLQ